MRKHSNEIHGDVIEMKKLLFPLVIGAGLLGVMIFLANTSAVRPLIQYIHTNSITPLGGVICIVAGLAAFYTVFRILVKLGNDMLPDGAKKK